jgi:hypothetical protein
MLAISGRVSPRTACVHGRGDLARHLGGRDQGLLVEVAAALGQRLVLDLDGAGARTLEQPHRARDVEGVAVAGVGIDHQRGCNPVADQRDGVRHLGHRHEADVGAAQPRVGDGRAGHVERGETGLRGQRGGECVVHARGDNDRLLAKPRCKGRRHPASISMSVIGICKGHLSHMPR